MTKKSNEERGAAMHEADAPPGETRDTAETETDVEEEARQRADISELGSEETGARDRELGELREELDEARSEKLRLLAEFRNFRQRMERDRARIRADAACGFFGALLPIVHDLERAREAANDTAGESGDESIAEGIDLVLRRFADFLRKEGVVEVDPVGEPFDEGTMEAMGMMPSEEHAEGRVARVFQKGLLLGERLIEPARVLVSSGPADGTSQEDDAE